MTEITAEALWHRAHAAQEAGQPVRLTADEVAAFSALFVYEEDDKRTEAQRAAAAIASAAAGELQCYGVPVELVGPDYSPQVGEAR